MHDGCQHHGQKSVGEVMEKLRRDSRRITGPRQAILDVLRNQAHPMTNKEILTQLPAGNCDLATVYRSIHLLEKMGCVQRFDFGDGVARYELVREGEEAHHHHLICVRCSDIVEVDECFPAELEQRIAEKNGFKAVRHKLEFFGLCPQCQ